MKSAWKVTSNIIADEKMYAVYRLIDADEVDHSGNREFTTGYMSDRNEAVSTADRLNKEACK